VSKTVHRWSREEVLELLAKDLEARGIEATAVMFVIGYRQVNGALAYVETEAEANG
jgi:hypothetical protein